MVTRHALSRARVLALAVDPLTDEVFPLRPPACRYDPQRPLRPPASLVLESQGLGSGTCARDEVTRVVTRHALSRARVLALAVDPLTDEALSPDSVCCQVMIQSLD